jgi:hypothetical protein
MNSISLGRKAALNSPTVAEFKAIPEIAYSLKHETQMA